MRCNTRILIVRKMDDIFTFVLLSIDTKKFSLEENTLFNGGTRSDLSLFPSMLSLDFFHFFLHQVILYRSLGQHIQEKFNL